MPLLTHFFAFLAGAYVMRAHMTKEGGDLYGAALCAAMAITYSLLPS